MKKNRSLAAVFLALFLCASAWAASNFTTRSGGVSEKPVVLAQPRADFVDGEKLIYDVSWMGVPVGIGELTLQKKKRGSRDIYFVTALAKTNEVLSKLYPVEDRIESEFDASDFRSLRFRKKLSEGHYHADEETLFDSSSGKGKYRSLKSGEEKEFDFRPGTHDLVSAFYAFRVRGITSGDRVHLPVSSEEKEWDVEIDVLRTEQKEMRGRVIGAVLVEPKTSLKGVLYRRGRVWVYLSAGERRIPLVIQLKTPFGPIVGVLRDFDTL